MELRMALHPGDFLRYIVNWTEKNIGPIHELLGTKGLPDRRMNDVELTVRHLGFIRQEIPYAGDLKGFLDRVCEDLNDRFSRMEVRDQIENQLEDMSSAIEAGINIMERRNFCRKYIDGKFEARFNRAIFDVQVAALVNEKLRGLALDRPENFRGAFLEASNNPQFIKAIESTTKTPAATNSRFKIFFAEIKKQFGIDLELPKIQLKKK